MKALRVFRVLLAIVALIGVSLALTVVMQYRGSCCYGSARWRGEGTGHPDASS